MQLLLAVIDDPDKVVDVLDSFLEHGITGATVIDSTGMAHLIADHVPFFSRFAELDDSNPSHNKTIFLVMESDASVKKAVRVIEGIVGDLDQPDTGLVVVLPITYCKGFHNQRE